MAEQKPDFEEAIRYMLKIMDLTKEMVHMNKESHELSKHSIVQLKEQVVAAKELYAIKKKIFDLDKVQNHFKEKQDLVTAITKDVHPSYGVGRGWSHYTGGMKDAGGWFWDVMLKADFDEMKKFYEEFKIVS